MCHYKCSILNCHWFSSRFISVHLATLHSPLFGEHTVQARLVLTAFAAAGTLQVRTCSSLPRYCAVCALVRVLFSLSCIQHTHHSVIVCWRCSHCAMAASLCAFSNSECRSLVCLGIAANSASMCWLAVHVLPVALLRSILTLLSPVPHVPSSQICAEAGRNTVGPVITEQNATLCIRSAMLYSASSKGVCVALECVVCSSFVHSELAAHSS